jgi:hypothetical protein
LWVVVLRGWIMTVIKIVVIVIVVADRVVVGVVVGDWRGVGMVVGREAGVVDGWVEGMRERLVILRVVHFVRSDLFLFLPSRNKLNQHKQLF